MSGSITISLYSIYLGSLCSLTLNGNLVSPQTYVLTGARIQDVRSLMPVAFAPTSQFLLAS